MNIIDKSIKGFFYTLCGAIFAFSLQMVFAKFLGAEKYGFLNYYLSIINFIFLISVFNVSFVLPKMIYKDNGKEKFNSFFWTLTIVYLILTPVLIFILILSKINPKIVITICILAYLNIVNEIIYAYYVGVNKTQIGYFYRKFLYNILLLIISFILYFIYPDWHVYFIAMFLAYSLVIILNIKKLFSRIKIDFSIFKTGYKLYITSLLYGFFVHYSRILQKNFTTLKHVGVLSLAIVISKIIVMFGVVVSKTIISNLNTAWKKSDKKQLANILREAIRFNSYIVTPLVIFLIINIKNVILFIDESYLIGIPIFIMLLIGRFFTTIIGSSTGAVLNITDNEKYEIFNGCLKFLITTILIFIFKNFYWGIALGLAGGEIIINLIKVVQIKKIFAFKLIDKIIFRYLLFISIISGFTFYFISLIQCLKLWFCLSSLLLILIYIAIFFYSPNKKDKQFIVLQYKKVISFIKKN